MTAILYAVISVTVIGLVCAVVLVVAGKVMAVKTDEKFEQVRACLPGANCGACGYAGCDGYAAALASGETKQTNLCIPGGNDASQQVAAVLGLKAAEVQPQAAFVRCSGTCDKTQKKYDYAGISTCQAAKQLFGGPGACSYGCLGLGDCQGVCEYGAICLEDGVARVDPRLCVACGKCAKTCPQQLIVIRPVSARHIVACSNQQKGGQTRQACQVGCIGCKKCELSCPEKAITVENNLARIDFSKCSNCGKCVEVCPSGCIAELTGA